jgi:hypothetical protein
MFETMKKSFSLLTMGVLMLLSASLISCTNDDDNQTDLETLLSGTITDTKTLDADKVYTITGPVIIENGGVLDIPAGTTIKAKKGFSSYILVLQGGKIYVRGTASEPVTMTADSVNATAGYWGGLIINGKAPLGGGLTGSTEINSSYVYGGTVANDNSGSISYLKLEYCGARSSANVEHNGLTLNGVGSGTTIENVYVLKSADDGIEFFGGSVNVTNLLVVDPDDDMFDFTQGYNGTLTNAYGIWQNGYTSTESDPRGIEADGNFDGNYQGQTDQSDFRVANVTFDLRLAPGTSVATQMMDLIKIRREARAVITNALVKGTGTIVDLVDFTDSKGAGLTTSSVSLTSTLINPIAGKQVNPDATTYPLVEVVPGNVGCAPSVFTWTGYVF